MADSQHPAALRALQHFDSLFPDTAALADPHATSDRGSASHRLRQSISPGRADTMQLVTAPQFAKRYGKVAESKASGVTYTPGELADFVADQMLRIADLPAMQKR